MPTPFYTNLNPSGYGQTLASVPYGYGPGNVGLDMDYLGQVIPGIDSGDLSGLFDPNSALYERLLDRITAMYPNREDYVNPLGYGQQRGVPLDLASVLGSLPGGIQGSVIDPAMQLMGPLETILGKLTDGIQANMFARSGGAYGTPGPDAFDQTKWTQIAPVASQLYQNSIMPFLQNAMGMATANQGWQTNLAQLDWNSRIRQADVANNFGNSAINNLQNLAAAYYGQALTPNPTYNLGSQNGWASGGSYGGGGGAGAGGGYGGMMGGEYRTWQDRSRSANDTMPAHQNPGWFNSGQVSFTPGYSESGPPTAGPTPTSGLDDPSGWTPVNGYWDTAGSAPRPG